MKNALKDVEKKNCKAKIFLDSGVTFTAKVSSILDDTVVFVEIEDTPEFLNKVTVKLSKIDFVGELKESGDDKSAFSSNGLKFTPLQ